MTKRMLIDATHAEETRVVVMDGNRLDDYDVEAANRKQLKGNIYLAKVIRVEPSLQAAFVEYGGNRHGFLAFSEIHPDYYQIPVADREKLLALQEEEAVAPDADTGDGDGEEGEDVSVEVVAEEGADTVDAEVDASTEETSGTPDYVGGETDTGEEALVQKRMARFLRSYKIQDVIRRRQILLVQVVKEERGNKGAALTTYISLAGRYCVLMPNALRGGGVSRKITSAADRKRLKDIIAELQLPRGMAMIVRTAGAQRPRPEVMRDCEYLLHLWDDIREHTLRSVAPALIYEEASLVKRAIRDVYTRDVEEIVVDGEAGWRSARDFMRMLMPQSANRVKMWRKDKQPLFSHYHVEGLLDAMLSPTVQLRSGGYLVINQTEALVAIDVNSGRSTRERNIEETAVRTNLEAAEEVARQLRLRDLAGLIVIDFIDMESRRHNAQVERRLKDALRNDRARIQVGGISHFGLLEMSRQRLRPSLTESAFIPCPHCQGTGIVRGIESSALHVLRAIEEEGGQRRASEITVHVAGDIALYILNHKRDWLTSIENRHKMQVLFAADSSLPAPQVRIERRRAQTAQFDVIEHGAVTAETTVEPDEALLQDEVPAESEAPAVRAIPIANGAPPVESLAAEARETEEQEEGEENGQRRRRRRRRRRSGGQREDVASQNGVAAKEEGVKSGTPEEDDTVTSPDGSSGKGSGAGEAVLPSSENLMPGRSRTRVARKGTREPQRPVAQPHAQPQPQARRAETNRPAASSAAPAWRGPTPADPFGGSFDIFDMMEQAEYPSEEPQVATRAARADVAPVEELPMAVSEPDEAIETVVEAQAVVAPEMEGEEKGATPRRRGRGRRRSSPVTEETVLTEVVPAEAAAAAVPELPPLVEAPEEEKPRARRSRSRRKVEGEAGPVVEAQETVTPPAAEKKPKNTRKPVVVEPVVIDDTTPAGKPRKGWWNR